MVARLVKDNLTGEVLTVDVADDATDVEIHAAAQKAVDAPMWQKGLGAANDIARNLNIGATSMIPGARGVANMIGAAQETTPPTPFQSGLRTAGGTLGTLGLMAAGVPPGATTTADTSALRGVLNASVDAARQAPGMTTAAEAGAGFASGATGQYMKDQYGPSAELPGQVVGGLTGPAVVGGAASYLKSPVSIMGNTARMLGRAAANVIPEETPLIGKLLPRSPPIDPRAVERLYRADPNITGTLNQEAPQTLPGVGLTVGERSGQPGLLALQRSAINQDAKNQELKVQEQARYQAINQKLVDNFELMKQGMLPNQIASAVRDRAMNDLANQSIADARRAVAALPNADQEQSIQIARNTAEGAYNAARGAERKAWEAVNLKAPAQQTNLTAAFSGPDGVLTSESQNAVKQILSDIPPGTKSMLGTMAPNQAGQMEFTPGALSEKQATVGELKDFRSVMLRIQRDNLQNDRPVARVAGILADGAMQDLMAVPDTSNEYLNAIGVSKALNQTFRQGYMGKVLGYTGSGDLKTPDIKTLEGVRQVGVAGAANIDSMLQAARYSGDPNLMQSAIRNYVANDFLNRPGMIDREGNLNAAAAQSYLLSHRQALDRMPELRDAIGTAIDKTTNASDLVKQISGANVKTVLAADDPQLAAKQAMATLSLDKTGKAQIAFRSEFLGNLLDRSTVGVNPGTQTPLISGQKMGEAMTDQNTIAAAKEVLTPAQWLRLKRINATASAYETGARALPSKEGVLGDSENFAMGLLRKAVGASIGREFGVAIGQPGTVQLPSFGVSLMQKFKLMGIDPAERMITSAVLSGDDKLMRALSEGPRALKSTKDANDRTIRAWMAHLAAQTGVNLADSVDPKYRDQFQTEMDLSKAP